MPKDNGEKYFYVYYSYEPWGRGYIGKRECWCLPEEDKKYFGSFYDKTFKPTEKIILYTFKTKKDAYMAESILHEFYQVDVNPNFANKVKQKNKKGKFNKSLRIENPDFKNKFIIAVKNSTSVRQIILKLNLKETGGNYQSVNSWIKLLNLDTSHFVGQGWSKGKKFGDRLSEDQKEKSHYKYLYTIITPEGETIITKNLREFCRKRNLNNRNMWAVSVGKLKQCKGYKVTKVFL